ncbi:hypothetical protein DV515_00003706 [Chloebia gouldiae]|uniref:Myb/SANT-like DNA-binding domain-containing protein n=1 Tax=Chloebia gouldiae TaxID=44316 RepID=A0A3L8STN4_CHLGU|nr:hypothetical protein DV515_00003706 [Chloebia gouldiae]
MSCARWAAAVRSPALRPGKSRAALPCSREDVGTGRSHRPGRAGRGPLAAARRSDPGRPRMITNTRGFLWSDLETRALLEIWGEADVQSALDGNFRNSHVYRDVACRLAELGFERTPEQCRIRIKGLKRQYYQARDGLKKNGHARKICNYREVFFTAQNTQSEGYGEYFSAVSHFSYDPLCVVEPFEFRRHGRLLSIQSLIS